MRVYSGGGRRVAGGTGEKRPARGGKRLQPAKKRRRAPKILLTAAGVTLVTCLMLVRGVGLPEKVFGEEPKEQELIPLTEARPAESEPTGAQREEGHFLLSFAGDCTLGTEHGSWGKSGTFPEVVGENYAYPFAGVQSLFARDDFTFVNLEGTLTSHTVPAEKQFRFRGPTSYGAILTEGSVEAVTLANNHTLDYGKAGLQETRQVLKDLGVAAGGDGETFLYTASRGLKIGVYTAYHFDRPQIRQGIETLQNQGAELIIAAFHSGAEGSYTPTARQKDMFRYAADCGAHIVYNSHPHVLQPVEHYRDSVIFYSLGNFSFGGNRNPSDKDTVVIQVEVERQADGSVVLSQVLTHPCSVSSRMDRNDYQPTLCEADSTQAQRVERKLAGTYRPPAPKPEKELPQAAAPQETPAEESLPEDPAEVPDGEETSSPAGMPQEPILPEKDAAFIRL